MPNWKKKPSTIASPSPCDPLAKTAVLLVNGYNGLGLHTLLNVTRLFPGVFRNFVFLQVGVVDAGNFKGADEIEHLRAHIAADAETATAIGTDIVQSASELAATTAQRFPNSVFFGGQLVFADESRWTRLLHNFAVFALQREFFRRSLPFLIVPVKV